MRAQPFAVQKQERSRTVVGAEAERSEAEEAGGGAARPPPAFLLHQGADLGGRDVEWCEPLNPRSWVETSRA